MKVSGRTAIRGIERNLPGFGVPMSDAIALMLLVGSSLGLGLVIGLAVGLVIGSRRRFRAQGRR
jgi:hypothetical protein